ncbi:MAG: YbjQ family protein [Chloroflexota bacterium]
MIVTTSEQIAGTRIARVVGLAKGNTIRARHVGRDIAAFLRGMVGGEITEYTKMMAQAREEAIDRMIEDAQAQGANAIVSMRFTTSMVMANAAEILAYGTGVVLE